MKTLAVLLISHGVVILFGSCESSKDLLEDKTSVTPSAPTTKTPDNEITIATHTEELIMADALFIYGDVNKDGVITPQEIFYFFRDLIKFSMKQASVATKLTLLSGDFNKDGVLSWSESLQAMAKMHNPAQPAHKSIKITE